MAPSLLPKSVKENQISVPDKNYLTTSCKPPVALAACLYSATMKNLCRHSQFVGINTFTLLAVMNITIMLSSSECKKIINILYFGPFACLPVREHFLRMCPIMKVWQFAEFFLQIGLPIEAMAGEWLQNF